MLLHESIYFSVVWDEANEMFEYVFNEKTVNMTVKQYVAELTVFINLVKKYKPKRVFGDMVNFMLAIPPDTQEWVNANLFSVYHEIGFKKIAILLSEEFIASLSIQQTMEEDKTHSFQTQFFDNKENAMAWLLAK